MTHEMKLQPRYYDYISKGTKRIEIRLYDDKRQKIKVGDNIKFFKLPDLKEEINTTVTDILKYSSFEELISSFPIEILSDKSMTKEQLLKELSTFYTKKEEQNYGVVALKIDINC